MTDRRAFAWSVAALVAFSCAASACAATLYEQFISTNDATRRAWMDDAAMRKKMAENGTPPEGAPEVGVPQWYSAPGVDNLRDVGGWTGLGGRRLRKGLILRSAHLQSVKGRREFRARFGVKTDLDLRTTNETAKLEGKSPLGGNVALVNMSAPTYGDFDKPRGMKYFKEVFTLFLDRANYPIVFHCAKGADRTGSIAFLLQGLLGVCERDQALDWELTAVFNPNPKFRAADRYDKLVALVEKRAGSTWTEKFETYAAECGISKEDVETFRKLMLEGDEKK